MKIALCFSGQPRYLREAYENIKENLMTNEHEIDVFAHFWWQDEYVGEVISRGSSNKYTENMENYFQEMYHPVKMVCEPYIDVNTPESYKTAKYPAGDINDAKLAYYNAKSMFYSIQQSLEYAFDSGKEYDLYVRIRSDITLDSVFRWDTFTNNKMYVVDGRGAGHDRYLTDVFALGNLNQMRKYSRLYNYIDKYMSEQPVHMHLYLIYVLQNEEKGDITTFNLSKPGERPYRGWHLIRPQNENFFKETQINKKEDRPSYLNYIYK